VAFDKKDSELLAEQLELLKQVSEAAYKEVAAVAAQQELFRKELEAGIISQDEYNKKVKETTESLSEQQKEVVKAIESQKKLAEAEKLTLELQQDAEKQLGRLTAGYQKLLSTTEAFTGVNVTMLGSLTSIGQTAKEFAMALDEQQVGLRRSTGFATRYTKNFQEMGKAFRRSGLGIEDLGQSISSLSNNFAGFDTLSENNRNNLIKLSADAKNLGMDFDDFSGVIDKLNYAFGQRGASFL